MGMEGRNNFIHYTTMVQAKNNAEISGDLVNVILTEDCCIAAIADGLGSGAGANASATVVVNELSHEKVGNIADILYQSNLQMKGKRGAVAAIIKIRFEQKVIEYTSIGNISCYVFNPIQEKVIYPRQKTGYLSGMDQTFTVQAMEYQEGDFFLLHTDGIQLGNPRSLLDEEEFIKLQRMHSEVVHIQNDDASFIAGRLF
ncbi:MAG: SpoIIE family protein phosphatase [Kurthia sp.]|uniref:Serine phosphatase n=1 Tax=Kurthia zopfii TaxID=1650 RepID=A0A8B4QDP1_9BACL|nr:SpoIIE family protein phosphatase [Kurthia zopfii]TDR42225.1 serine phosphatase [Kurthia zopfii]GEK29835.1 hypothetical protein KZO01_01440 [Kurthia zopfii]STX10856.1 Stage II sporulation protein E (SpoIIE) [Kurthia zopfii]